ncbi:hypothetical protein A2533_01515 [Candidatus Falkowbacteria bacterium RIFOXYD2_FULL_35_9]|nr:MAG: hypothetical protein A2533_01515 [Candidatus Falkowbacteria bacterium RIFOXYD2_FULL_35_9]
MKKQTRKRINEIFPASLAWTALIGSIVLSFVKPLWVIYFVIVFDLFWLIRIAYFSILLYFSWKNFRREIKINWMDKLKQENKDWKRIYHYVILPTAGEPFEVLDTTLNSLTRNDFPLDHFMVHLAGEERFQDQFLENWRKLEKKYSSKFFKFFRTVHPDGLPGEMKGKGANAHYGGMESKAVIDKLGIAYEDVICSYFDSDTQAHPSYFSNLTYKYLTTENPLRKAYQPAVVYNNNIWESPAITRVTAFGTVFWLMAELVRPERMQTFSSHSMPYKALVDVGFWQKDIVTDDSRIFLQGFFHYDGDFEVVPMYVPVSMDNVEADTMWQSAKNLYKQQRRWAWGVEHYPYMKQKFLEHPKISKWVKFKLLWNATEGMFFWATAPLFIFILGRLPLWVASLGHESSSVMVQNTPFVLEWLMGLAMTGIFVSAIFSLLVLPPKPESHPKSRWLVMIFQWILLPFTLVLFGAFPALDAQTRLALGKKYHLGFWVTPKKRS